MLYVLSVLDYSATLLFGVFASAAFTGLILHKKNLGIFLSFSAAAMLLESFCFLQYGSATMLKICPLIIHLPLVLLLILYYKKEFLVSVVAVTSAYLCCQFSKWLYLLAWYLIGEKWAALIIRILITMFLTLFILRFIAPSVAVILSQSRNIALGFGLLPIIYYLFDYSTVIYTDLLYQGSELAFEFLPFFICIVYFIFCTIYFKEYSEKCEMEYRIQIAQLQDFNYHKDVEAMKHSAQEVARLNHDMRHFLIGIKACIENNETDEALESIHELLDGINQTTHRRFCENNLVNVVISYFESRMQENGIELTASVKIPEKLPCSDLDFTSILANGLENSLNAVCKVAKGSRHVTLSLKMNGDKLLLSIQNPYIPSPSSQKSTGFPTMQQPGHGLGIYSIKYVTEKLNGNCHFSIKDGEFLLRVVL